MLVGVERQVRECKEMSLFVEATEGGVPAETKRADVRGHRGVADGVAEAESTVLGRKRQEVSGDPLAVSRSQLCDQQACRGASRRVRASGRLEAVRFPRASSYFGRQASFVHCTSIGPWIDMSTGTGVIGRGKAVKRALTFRHRLRADRFCAVGECL